MATPAGRQRAARLGRARSTPSRAAELWRYAAIKRQRYLTGMPVISRFLGIAIAILYRDHDPPHFHAAYGEYEVTVGIRDGVVTGRFPRRALLHVLE